jgi:hypothetical protein
MAGRPPAVTPKVLEALLKALEIGATHKIASQYAGISLSTFQLYLSKGRKDREDGVSSIYSNFSDAVEKAESSGTIQDLERIRKAADEGIWQAAAWRAERRWPDEYGRRVTQVQGPDGGPVEVKLQWPNAPEAPADAAEGEEAEE